MDRLLNALERLRQFGDNPELAGGNPSGGVCGVMPHTDPVPPDEIVVSRSGIVCRTLELATSAGPTAQRGSQDCGAIRHSTEPSATASTFERNCNVAVLSRESTGPFTLNYVADPAEDSPQHLPFMAEAVARGPAAAPRDSTICERETTTSNLAPSFSDKMIEIDESGAIHRPEITTPIWEADSFSEPLADQAVNSDELTLRELRESSTPPLCSAPPDVAATPDILEVRPLFAQELPTDPNENFRTLVLEAPLRPSSAMASTSDDGVEREEGPINDASNDPAPRDSTEEAQDYGPAEPLTAEPIATHVPFAEPTSQEQMDAALDYAFRVMSENEHLTLDLLRPSTQTSPAERTNDLAEQQQLEWQSDLSRLGLDIRRLGPEWDLPGDDLIESRVLEEIEAVLNADEPNIEATVPGLVSPAAQADLNPAEVAKPIPPSTGATRLETADVRETEVIAGPPLTPFENDLKTRLRMPPFWNAYKKLAHHIRRDVPSPSNGSIALFGCDDEPSVADIAGMLGLTFAADHATRVLLVDGNLTRQRITRALDLGERRGLAEVCAGVAWRQFVRPTGEQNLCVLPAGGRFDRKKIHRDLLITLVPQWNQEFNLVIVDAGDVNSPFAIPFLHACDVSYLVVCLGRTERKSALRTLEVLRESANQRIACIVNNIPQS